MSPPGPLAWHTPSQLTTGHSRPYNQHPPKHDASSIPRAKSFLPVSVRTNWPGSQHRPHCHFQHTWTSRICILKHEPLCILCSCRRSPVESHGYTSALVVETIAVIACRYHFASVVCRSLATADLRFLEQKCTRATVGIVILGKSNEFPEVLHGADQLVQRGQGGCCVCLSSRFLIYLMYIGKRPHWPHDSSLVCVCIERSTITSMSVCLSSIFLIYWMYIANRPHWPHDSSLVSVCIENINNNKHVVHVQQARLSEEVFWPVYWQTDC